MASLTKAVTIASKKLGLGRVWDSEDECVQRMRKADWGDWLMAGVDPRYDPNLYSNKIYSLTLELASLIPPL